MALMTRAGRIMALMLVALMALSACGNDRQERIVSLDTLRSMVKRPGPVPQVSAQDLQTNLANTKGPLELAVREDQKGWSFFLRIENNGGFDTYGNGERQTMTTRGGIITATRGLGGDVMSSDISGVAPLILGRRSGEGQRIMRFLDGEDRTREIVFACRVTRGQPAPVQLGEVDTTATTMTEVCQAEGLKITNTFLVDGSGRSLGSRQWLGEFTGYMLTQTLRR